MESNRTTITAIDIPFGRMLMILLKAMIPFCLIMIPILLLCGGLTSDVAALFAGL